MRDFRRVIQVLARKAPGPLYRLVKRFFVPGFVLRDLNRDGEVRQLQRAMQAGFGKVSAEKLQELKSTLASVDLADAAWSLACWYRLNGDYERALDHLLMRRLADPRVLWDDRHIVIEVDLLLKLGREEAARSTVENAIARLGEVPEFCLCAANVAASGSGQTQSDIDRLRLSWLNKVFVGAGLSPIELKDPARPLTIDNIAAPSAQLHSRSGEAKISVLMPAYNAENTIATAAKSILDQTWSNLELIVVDDGSSDGTWSIIEFVARRDPRVVPLRHPRNRGAYAARNTALSHATGDFVTVHDADDWSHPEKVALQAIALMEGSEVANATNKIRVSPRMRIASRPHGSILNECYASLMMSRNVIVELGGWDECRMAADDELWQRLLLKHAANKTVLSPKTPMSFYLVRTDSLTNQGATGLSTNSFGARRQYTEAYRYWHEAEREKTEPDWSMRPGLRRFPIPALCKPGPTKRLAYDVLFVSDFSRSEDAPRNAGPLRNAHALGLRSACFHWPRLDGAGLDLDPAIRKLLHDGFADNVVAGESLTCRLTVVSDAAILDHLPDTLPEIRAGACLILAERDPAGSCATNAKAALGIFPQLASIRQIDEALMGLAEDAEPKSSGKTEPAPGESALANL